MTQEKTQAEAALTAATAHHQSVTREMRNAITEEQKKIEARYAPLLADALEAKRACTAELDRINVALAASNPLIGRKLHRVGTGRTYRQLQGTPEATGIIEAFQIGDEYLGHSRPQAGEIVVRHLKKDGTRGMKVERMHFRDPNKLPDGWNFIDTDAAEQKDS